MTEELEGSTEARSVAQAVLGVAAAVAHRETRVPGMGEDRPGYDLPSLGDSLDELARTELMSAPAKAEVFARVHQEYGRLPELEPLALSLVDPDLLPTFTDDEQRAILDEIFATTAGRPAFSGRDVFQRQLADLFEPTPLMQKLRTELREFLVEFEPVDCRASVVSIGNKLALSIETTGYTRRPLASLVDIIDPLNWPRCALQHLFFQSMTKVGDLSDLAIPDAPQPPPPANNWKGRLREVVDWSFGGGWKTFTTDLDFVFFQSSARVGCTYDLGEPVDHQVTVDQGYLLAEDLGSDLRRVRTLKQVHFAIGDLDPLLVCGIWGWAIQILAWACIGHIHTPPN